MSSYRSYLESLLEVLGHHNRHSIRQQSQRDNTSVEQYPFFSSRRSSLVANRLRRTIGNFDSNHVYEQLAVAYGSSVDQHLAAQSLLLVTIKKLKLSFAEFENRDVGLIS
jgi:hypothetical protein